MTKQHRSITPSPLAYETLDIAPTTEPPYRYPPDRSGKSLLGRLGQLREETAVVFRDKCGAIVDVLRAQADVDWFIRNIINAVRLCTVDNTAPRSSETDYPACEEGFEGVALPQKCLEYDEIRVGICTNHLEVQYLRKYNRTDQIAGTDRLDVNGPPRGHQAVFNKPIKNPLRGTQSLLISRSLHPTRSS